MNAQLSGIRSFNESVLAEKLEIDKESVAGIESELGEASEMLEGLARQIYENPALREMDIRMKAKEIGANGLVHVQLYTKEGTYMGVPVELIKPSDLDSLL